MNSNEARLIQSREIASGPWHFISPSLPDSLLSRDRQSAWSCMIRRDRAAAFIAGGIGITPFMSILRQAAQEQSPQHFLLLYSNRAPDEAAFLEELQQLNQGSMHFRLTATMTGVSQPKMKTKKQPIRRPAAFPGQM